MVEVILALPVVFAAVFFALWYSYATNAKAALDSAVPVALRLAVTRGAGATTPGSFSAGQYPLLDAFFADNNCSGDGCSQEEIKAIFWNESPDIPRSSTAAAIVNHHILLSKPPAVPGGSSHGTSYIFDLVAHNFSNDGPSTRGLPRTYLYALVYTLIALKQSVGNTVRYPCDPEDTTKASRIYDGCLICDFLNPTGLAEAKWDTSPVPENAIRMRCRYRPRSMFVGPLLHFLGRATGSANLGVYYRTAAIGGG